MDGMRGTSKYVVKATFEVEGVQIEEYLGELQLRVSSGKITVE